MITVSVEMIQLVQMIQMIQKIQKIQKTQKIFLLKLTTKNGLHPLVNITTSRIKSFATKYGKKLKAIVKKIQVRQKI